MAYIPMAYGGSRTGPAAASDGLHSCGLNTYGLNSYGLYSYGLRSYGLRRQSYWTGGGGEFAWSVRGAPRGVSVSTMIFALAQVYNAMAHVVMAYARLEHTPPHMPSRLPVYVNGNACT